MSALTRWVLAHKRWVVVFWVIATVAGIAASAGLGSRLDQKESVPGREGSQTNQAILRLYGNGGSAEALVAVATLPRGTTVSSPGVRAQLNSAFARIVAALPVRGRRRWCRPEIGPLSRPTGVRRLR